MNKIKNGYISNDADVFELCCDDQKKVDEYREMFDIKQRVKDGKISEQDYQKELMKRYQKTSFSGSAVEFIRAYLDSQELTAEDLEAIRALVEKKQQEVK